MIHRGVYYAPGSLKARLCVAGAAALETYCAEREIPVLRCGKVVVATTPEEIPRLEELHRRSVANGVPEVELIGPERLRELEPHAAGLRALHSPATSVVDFALVARGVRGRRARCRRRGAARTRAASGSSVAPARRCSTRRGARSRRCR